MDITSIITLLSYTIPAMVTGLVAFYFFKNHTNNEERKLKLQILKENQKHSLPIRLQAYERMTLFLERINPAKLLIRITSVNDDKEAYLQSLITSIEKEFEHNLAQQIYISEKCWNVIIASKNATIHIIQKTAEQKNVESVQDLRESILKRMVDSAPPSTTALAFIKDEVKSFI